MRKNKDSFVPLTPTMKIRFTYGILALLYECCYVHLKILGPPPGSPGTIDFRYPNAMVEPILECPFDGVFPHPKNCSWYYRCHSHYTGYYHRTFYHCEPGTIFNDTLDQCTFPSTTKCHLDLKHCNRENKCTDWSDVYYKCQEYDVCPPTLGEPVKMTLCLHAKRECKNCLLTQDICGPGMTYSPSDDKCYLSPDHPLMACNLTTTPTPTPSISPTTSSSSTTTIITTTEISCDNCHISTSKCRSYQACPDGGTEINLILCTEAVSVCLPCQSEKSVCEEGKYFAMEDSRCYFNPDHPSMRCLSTSTTSPAITLNTPMTTTTVTPESCNDCRIIHISCEHYEVCPYGEERINMILCSKAIKQCLPCFSEEDVCKIGDYYSLRDSTCYQSPDTPEMECFSSTPRGEVINSTFLLPTMCSTDELIPDDDWIQQTFCSVYSSCEASESLAAGRLLCENYYKCVFDGDYWQIVKMKCPEGFLFSYETTQCVPIPVACPGKVLTTKPVKLKN